MDDPGLKAIVQRHNLAPMGVRPPFLWYLAEAFRRRDFAVTLAAYRLQAANAKTRLGMGWIVLRPLISAAVYGLIFGMIMPAGSRPDNFVAYLIVGVFLFEFFSRSLSEGSRSILQNVNLVKNLSFPRILLPVASVVQQVLELLVMLAVLFVLLIALGEPITWNWLLLIPVAAMFTLFNVGVALLAARLSLHLPDLTQILPHVTRILFYSSGIFFALDRVLASRPDLLQIAYLNPVHDFIALARGFLLQGAEIQPIFWWVTGISTAVVFIGGVILFWHVENRYGEDQ